MARDHEVSASDIAAMLNRDAANLARTIFPAGREYGGFFHIGSIEGEAGDSLKIRTRGNKTGSWADYSMDAGARAGKGDMLKLVQLTVANGDLGEAVRWAKGWLGMDQMDAGKLARVRDRARAAAERQAKADAGELERKRLSAINLWGHGRPLLGTPAQRYLEGRGIDFARLGRMPGALRFRDDVWCSERRMKAPAMVSLFVDVMARPVAIHLTFLALIRGAWAKAPISTAKRIRSPAYWGAHIPIHRGAAGRVPLRDVPEGTVVRIAEGIEDGLTIAMADPSRRVVAAGTLGNIGAMRLPDAVRTVELVCQHDRPGSPADHSLEVQIGLHQQAGRRVMCLWPEPQFKDFNDQLRGVAMGQASA